MHIDFTDTFPRQCLPFMLRRAKADVLKDLPPKIIQDYYCELSPLQKLLYEDFARSKAKKSIDSSLTDNDPMKEERQEKITHIFQVSFYFLTSEDYLTIYIRK